MLVLIQQLSTVLLLTAKSFARLHKNAICLEDAKYMGKTQKSVSPF